MLKCFYAILVTLVLIINSVSFAIAGSKRNGSQVTQVEEREAREIARQFTLQFIRTKDLAPILKDLYWSDFIERYKQFRSKDLNGDSRDLLLVSGLDYNSRLLTEGNSEDWQRFYIAANNFLLLGFLVGLKHHLDGKTDFKPTDIYPPSVFALLDNNLNLANMIVRKGSSKAVSSVEEMRNATATLEQAVSVLRQKERGRSLATIEKKLTKVMSENEIFKPRLEIADGGFFGFAKGTRIILMNAPIGRLLLLARDGNRLKIFATEILAD